MVTTRVDVAVEFKDKVHLFKEKQAPPFAKFVLRTSSWSAAVLVDAISVGPSKGAVIQVKGLPDQYENIFIYSVGNNYYFEFQSVFLARIAKKVNPSQVNESKRLNSGFILKFGSLHIKFERGLAPIVAPPSPEKRRPTALNAEVEPHTHPKRLRRVSVETMPPLGIQPPVQPIGIPASLQRRMDASEQAFTSKASSTGGLPHPPEGTRSPGSTHITPALNNNSEPSVPNSDLPSVDHYITNSDPSAIASSAQGSAANSTHDSQNQTSSVDSTSFSPVSSSDVRAGSQSINLQASPRASENNDQSQVVTTPTSQNAEKTGVRSSGGRRAGRARASISATESQPAAGQQADVSTDDAGNVRELIRQEKEQRLLQRQDPTQEASQHKRKNGEIEQEIEQDSPQVREQVDPKESENGEQEQQESEQLEREHIQREQQEKEQVRERRLQERRQRAREQRARKRAHEKEEREKVQREQQEREEHERREKELEEERAMREIARREVIENQERARQQWERIRQLRLQTEQQNDASRRGVQVSRNEPENHSNEINDMQGQRESGTAGVHVLTSTNIAESAEADAVVSEESGTSEGLLNQRHMDIEQRVEPDHIQGPLNGPQGSTPEAIPPREEGQATSLNSEVGMLRESLLSEVKHSVAQLQRSLITEMRASLNAELTQTSTEVQNPLIASMNSEISDLKKGVAQVHNDVQELRKHVDISVESLMKRVSRAVNLITAVNETTAQQLGANVESAVTQIAANVNQQLDSSMRQMNNSFASGMRHMQTMLSNGPDLDLDPSESLAHSERD